MKAILEFILPDDDDQFKVAANATKYLSALEDLANKIRSKVKYSEEESVAWEKVKDLFWETLEEAGVELF